MSTPGHASALYLALPLQLEHHGFDRPIPCKTVSALSRRPRRSPVERVRLELGCAQSPDQNDACTSQASDRNVKDARGTFSRALRPCRGRARCRS